VNFLAVLEPLFLLTMNLHVTHKFVLYRV